MFIVALIIYQVVQQEARDQLVQQARQQAWEAHEQRQAWNRAHPAEVAKAKAAAIARAQAEVRAQNAQAARQLEAQRRITAEDDRIASIPYSTRLSHAKDEFDQLAGDGGLFVGAVIIHTYLKDDKMVLMVDQSAWAGLSPAEKEGYRSNAENYWHHACTDNFACSPDDIHSQDASESLAYQFTSAFDSQ